MFTHKDRFRNDGLGGVGAETAEHEDETGDHEGGRYQYEEEIFGDGRTIEIMADDIAAEADADGAQYLVYRFVFVFFFFCNGYIKWRR